MTTPVEAETQQIASAVQAVGEFTGWSFFPNESFNYHVGPFFHKSEAGKNICAFRAAINTQNGIGIIHGGALMTFADYCMFVAAYNHYGSIDLVTISMASEFVHAARPGQLIESIPEVVNAGGSLIVMRGMVISNDRCLLNYSGTFKRLSRKTSQQG